MLLVRVKGKDTESVVEARSDQIRGLPKAMMDTLTWDRGGTEMAGHKKFTIATDVAVYLCDPPKSPWQRATSENTNRRLLRQYLTRGADLFRVQPTPPRPRCDRAEATLKLR